MARNGGLRDTSRLGTHAGVLNRSGRIYPLYLLYLLGRFFRLLSVYVMYQYLMLPGRSVVIFMFLCLSGAATLLLIVHSPWRGRPLTSYQLLPTIINGALMALSFVLWGEGLRTCGPVRTVMAEYVGAVLGATSTLILGRGGGKLKKIAGLVAMCASYIFLSQGWAMSTYSPFSYKSGAAAEEVSHKNANVGFSSMALVFFSGALTSLNRVITRRVSLKKQMKRRLYVVSITAAACFLFPIFVFQATLKKSIVEAGELLFSFQAFVVYTVHGIVISFYVDLMAEERLHVLVASPKHLLVTTGCLFLLELIYAMDFSVLGFLVCASCLGFGIFGSMSMEKIQRDHEQLPTTTDLGDGMTEQRSSLIMARVLDPIAG